MAPSLPLSTPLVTSLWTFLGRPAFQGTAGVTLGGQTDLPTSKAPPLSLSAIAYLGQILGSSAERLFKEPSIAAAEEAKIGREIETVALNHYKVFIKSSRTVFNVSQKANEFEKHLDTLTESVNTLNDVAQETLANGQYLSHQRASLNKLREHQDRLLQLASVEPLLDACIRNGMSEEALKLLHFISTLLRVIYQYKEQNQTKEQEQKHEPYSDSHTSCSTDITPQEYNHFTSLEFFLNKTYQRECKRLQEVILKTLETPAIDISMCITSVGLLKQLYAMPYIAKPLKSLESIVFLHLQIPVEIAKAEAEALFLSNPVQSVTDAAIIIRTRVCEVITCILNLFDNSTKSISIPWCENMEKVADIEDELLQWVSNQILWLLSGLKQLLVPKCFEEYYCLSDYTVGPYRQNLRLNPSASSLKGKQEQISPRTSLPFSTSFYPPSRDIVKYFDTSASSRLEEKHQPISLFSLSTLYQQFYQTSETLSQFRADFFPIATLFFDTYLEAYLRVHFYKALTSFRREVEAYIWIPNVPVADAPYSNTSNNKSTLTEALRNISNHVPLARFSNSLLHILNELRFCALHSFCVATSKLLTQLLLAAIDILGCCGRRMGVLDIEGCRIGVWDRKKRDEHTSQKCIRARTRSYLEPTFSNSNKDTVHWNSKGEEFFLCCVILAEDLTTLLSEHLSQIFSDCPPSPVDQAIIIQHLKGMYVPDTNQIIITKDLEDRNGIV